MTKSSLVQSQTIELAKDLISRPSVTPEDGGCQTVIADRLAKLGFTIEHVPFGPVKNLWARLGSSSPLLTFLGHTDVVPTGPEDQWKFPPFEPTIEDGLLYGRGASDMKGCVAAFITALERFLSDRTFKGSLSVLLTSDEEADAVDGTVRVIDYLSKRGEKIDYCLVGEPSSEAKTGDTVKNGRRGSLSGTLKVKGKQGHVAYPLRADNAAHRALPALTELTQQHWDNGNQFFPATSFQISNIRCGVGADNVIPGDLEAVFNFRFSTELTPEQLKERVHAILDSHKLDYSIVWRLSGHPFLTDTGELLTAVRDGIRAVTGIETNLSTAGGTSDGRFVAPTGAQVVELGILNSTIHKVNECAGIEDLNVLSTIYEEILRRLSE